MIPAAIDQITVETPPQDVARAFELPAVERPDEPWWTWPNVIEGFQLATRERVDHPPPFPRPSAERGIVIVGGGQYLPSVYVTVRVLRHVGCQLPIEVWHFDGEDDAEVADAIRDYGATFVNADTVARQQTSRFLKWHWWKGWQLKAFALNHCGFRQVLLLDADSFPVRDPEYLFDWPEFQRRGAVLWPDLEQSPTVLHDSVLRLFEVPRPTDRLTESGQILMDREKSWRPLNVAAFFNRCADLVYRYVWGDKDTFPLAWRRCGQPYARMWPECDFDSDCLLQYDYRGHIAFQHRVADKFKLNGSRFASTFQSQDQNTYHAALAHESFCFHVLDELRSRCAAAAEKPPVIRSIEQMYPAVSVDLVCSDFWQDRFRREFLESGELADDPFAFDVVAERPHANCVSVSLFRQNADNRLPNEFPVDQAAWNKKYWAGLRRIVEQIQDWPNWKLRVYVEPGLIFDVLSDYSSHPQVEIFRMKINSVGASPGTLWRFLALGDSSLDLALVIDIDDPLWPKADHVRAFELDTQSTLGRVGGFQSAGNYLVAPGESDVRNYATIIASCIISRPRRIGFDMAACLRGFMAHRRHFANSETPWAYVAGDPETPYNRPIGGHFLGWGSHWYTYGFDERFLKHVLYYHFADRGQLHTWTESLPAARMTFEGNCDRRYTDDRRNITADPRMAARWYTLNLSQSALLTAFQIEERRWVFGRLLEIMRENDGAGYCGNVFFHDIDDPNCLDLVPKQINLFHVGRRASRVLEIGFNAGHSAALLLMANPRLTVRAFDTCGHAYTRPCLDFLNATFDDRIELIPGPSQTTVPLDGHRDFDLLHIDGDHDYAAVVADLANTLRKAVDGAIVVMDDHEPGNAVDRAIQQRGDLAPADDLMLHAPPPGSGHAVFRHLARR